MAEKSREQELARAAEELHEATTDLREILAYVRRNAQEQPQEQPPPRAPFLSGSGDPTLAERFEDELHGER